MELYSRYKSLSVPKSLKTFDGNEVILLSFISLFVNNKTILIGHGFIPWHMVLVTNCLGGGHMHLHTRTHTYVHARTLPKQKQF